MSQYNKTFVKIFNYCKKGVKLISSWRRNRRNKSIDKIEASHKIVTLIPRSFVVGLSLFLAFFLFEFAANISTAKAIETTSFLIDPTYDTREQNSITATKRITGIYAYYFVEDAYWNSKNSQEQNNLLADINSLSNEFDNIIYPKMHQIYGEEWIPGIDNDKRIYILLTDIKSDKQKGSYGGYFSTSNEYSKSLLDEYKKSQLETLENQKKADLAAGKNIDSYLEKEKEINAIFTNEKELLYLNVNFVNESSIKSFLAHEFQHMINWNKKSKISNVEEETWLNEAFSEYAPTALGYDNVYKGSILETSVNDFNRNPSDPLTEWENTSQDYSNVNLFMQFLVGHYGTDILKSIISSPKTGIAAINDALGKIDSQSNFSNVFSDWIITNYFNGQTIQEKIYRYANSDLSYENLHISATSSYMIYSNNKAKSSLIRSEKNIKPWSGKWYQFISSPILSVPDQTLKISLNSDTSEARFRVPYIIENSEGALTLRDFNLLGGQNENIYIDNFGTKIKSVTIMPINEGKTSAPENDGTSVKFSFAASIISPDQPSIKSISPSSSALGNRTLVTITGENFLLGATVKFGGIPATETTILDSKTIIAKAPPFYENTEVDIEITNPDKTAVTAPKSFAYTSFVPNGSLIRTEGDYKVYVVTGKYKRWIQSEKIFGFYNFKWSDIITVTPEIKNFYITSTLVRAENDYKVYEIGSDNKKHHLSMNGEKFSASGRQWDAIFIINNLEKNSYRTGAIITK